MTRTEAQILLFVLLISILFLGGCVERKLTILTEPAGALVTLNDEEIGRSPVTVSFQWYGDYNVRISEAGYETLVTHKKLDAPGYDKFPWDLFAQLSPKKIVDSYEWSFKLEPKEHPGRDELIESSQELQKRL